MSHRTATIDEFVLEGDRVTHRPTGAWFSASRGQPHIAFRSWGHVGEALPSGDDYAADEVQEVAARLLRRRVLAAALQAH